MKMLPMLLLCWLFALSPNAKAAVEKNPEDIANALNDEWAVIFYTLPSRQQADRFKALLPRIRQFKAEHPKRAEPLILEAVTLCTLVSAEWSFSALSDIDKAREMLIKAIDLDPMAMEAAAYIALGNLYYRLPGWPISFGDNDLAKQYLETAAKLYPNEVDSNYFIGDFWLGEGDYEKALYYLERADKAEVRPAHVLSDKHTKGEVQKALASARKKESGQSSFFSDIVPSFFKQ